MTDGWSWLRNSEKWHYFVGGRSLCGKWMGLRLGELEQGNDESMDNCTACKKALSRRRAKSLVEKLQAEGKVVLGGAWEEALK